MIDLHIHTKSSDGTDDCISILRKAESLNLSVISFTDHESCEMYNELKDIDTSKYYSGKIIPGVELKTVAKGIPIELLGYGVDPDVINKEVKKIYSASEEKDLIKMERLYENCKRVGVKLEDDVLEKYDNSYKYATTYLHEKITESIENKRYITDEASWNDDTTFFRRHMSNPKSRFYVRSNGILPSCDVICSLIKKAGGLVFIPHIYIYMENAKDVFNYLLENHQIDGVECYYSHFTDEQTEYLVNYCNTHGLYISGGTDYHGQNKPGINIGKGKGDLSISENIIKDWEEKVDVIENNIYDIDTTSIKYG
ncbi:MAG: PHP domain-containing protein [Clostridia bacterium]